MTAHVKRSVSEYPPELDELPSSLRNAKALDTYVAQPGRNLFLPASLSHSTAPTAESSSYFLGFSSSWRSAISFPFDVVQFRFVPTERTQCNDSKLIVLKQLTHGSCQFGIGHVLK